MGGTRKYDVSELISQPGMTAKVILEKDADPEASKRAHELELQGLRYRERAMYALLIFTGIVFVVSFAAGQYQAGEKIVIAGIGTVAGFVIGSSTKNRGD